MALYSTRTSAQPTERRRCCSATSGSASPVWPCASASTPESGGHGRRSRKFTESTGRTLAGPRGKHIPGRRSRKPSGLFSPFLAIDHSTAVTRQAGHASIASSLVAPGLRRETTFSESPPAFCHFQIFFLWLPAVRRIAPFMELLFSRSFRPLSIVCKSTAESMANAIANDPYWWQLFIFSEQEWAFFKPNGRAITKLQS